MRWAIGAELMKGDGDGLDPLGYATRAEAAAIVTRFVNYVVKK